MISYVCMISPEIIISGDLITFVSFMNLAISGLINNMFDDSGSSVSIIGRHQLAGSQLSYDHDARGNSCFRKLVNTWSNIKR